VRITYRLLARLAPDIARAYVDDILVKGAREDYSDREVLPRIRQWVYEHLLNLDRTLVNCELANATVAGKNA